MIRADAGAVPDPFNDRQAAMPSGKLGGTLEVAPTGTPIDGPGWTRIGYTEAPLAEEPGP